MTSTFHPHLKLKKLLVSVMQHRFPWHNFYSETFLHLILHLNYSLNKINKYCFKTIWNSIKLKFCNLIKHRFVWVLQSIIYKPGFQIRQKMLYDLYIGWPIPEIPVWLISAQKALVQTNKRNTSDAFSSNVETLQSLNVSYSIRKMKCA